MWRLVCVCVVEEKEGWALKGAGSGDGGGGCSLMLAMWGGATDLMGAELRPPCLQRRGRQRRQHMSVAAGGVHTLPGWSDQS